MSEQLPRKEAGYVIVDGKPLAAGVVCKCNEPGAFCPMHGKTAGAASPRGIYVVSDPSGLTDVERALGLHHGKK